MTVENFSTYTKVDPNNHMTVTASRVTHQSYQNEDSYIYKDFGVDYFGDFVHSIDFRITAADDTKTRTIWQLANAIDDYRALWQDAAQSFIAAYVDYRDGNYRLIFVECIGADANTNIDSYYTLALNTTYYLTITKIGKAITCKIYSDSGRTTLLTTLSLNALNEDYSFRYLYAANSWNFPRAGSLTAWCENLLLAGTDSSPGDSASGLWPSEKYISGYQPRYQKRQVVGFYADSGDLRSVQVNASGHLFTDVVIDVSSGLQVAISGQTVTISGDHVYVESGVGVVVQSGAGGVLTIYHMCFSMFYLSHSLFSTMSTRWINTWL